LDYWRAAKGLGWEKVSSLYLGESVRLSVCLSVCLILINNSVCMLVFLSVK
jgi:hypothetical protein